jgi:hypothetical protein
MMRPKAANLDAGGRRDRQRPRADLAAKLRSSSTAPSRSHVAGPMTMPRLISVRMVAASFGRFRAGESHWKTDRRDRQHHAPGEDRNEGPHHDERPDHSASASRTTLDFVLARKELSDRHKRRPGF